MHTPYILLFFTLLISYSNGDFRPIKIQSGPATNDNINNYGRLMPLNFNLADECSLKCIVNDQDLYLTINKTSYQARVVGKKNGDNIIVTEMYSQNNDVTFQSNSYKTFYLLLALHKGGKINKKTLKAFYFDRAVIIHPNVMYQGPFVVNSGDEIYKSSENIIKKINLYNSESVIEITPNQ